MNLETPSNPSMLTPQSLGLHLQEWTKELTPLEFLGKFNEFFADKTLSKQWILDWEVFLHEIALSQKHDFLQYCVQHFPYWLSLNFWDKNQTFPQDMNPENAVLNSFKAIWACFANMNLYHFNFLPDDIALKDRFAFLVKRSLWEDICLNGQDLSFANLSYWDLENANMRYANFNEAKLFYGKFKNCDFTHSTFVGIDIGNTIFENCFFIHADFKDAHIPQNNWKNCNFFDANFRNSEMSISDFDDSLLTYCNFENVNLILSVFTDTNIFKGNFFKARLENCDFSRANLTESTFAQSNISESRFVQTDLTDVNVDVAHAENAILREADISQQAKNILVKKGAKAQ